MLSEAVQAEVFENVAYCSVVTSVCGPAKLLCALSQDRLTNEMGPAKLKEEVEVGSSLSSFSGTQGCSVGAIFAGGSSSAVNSLSVNISKHAVGGMSVKWFSSVQNDSKSMEKMEMCPWTAS